MRQLATRPQTEYALIVLNGQDKGATYKLFDGRVRIGRGSENDIVIKDDPKISRNHAVVTISPQGAKISDVSDRNTVLVNGTEVRDVGLIAGAIIQLGNTKFQFRSNAPASLDGTSSGELSFAAPMEGLTLASAPHQPARASRPRSSSRGGQNKRGFYITVGIIVLAFAWLLTSNSAKKNTVGIRSDEDVQTQIASHTKIVEELEAEKRRLGTDTRQYEEAQPNFIKGFRDYRKGQYERAVESFQACLSLFPNHAQCQRYLRMAHKKFSELVQYHMILANKYRAQNQYAACQASYRNVMVMLKNPTDKTYLEAKSGFDLCQALEGDRY